ncbi:MAG TPA: glutamate synthase subunit alpha [Oscillatoriaceae cyanobacterium M33_DOE_052]|uniref:glutamate synthase (ferredoxin) n=1 Tax=Planktothricoides sp. SpSt-374 TaxID=2282167 RepID=A0A7C3ZGB1_9CYAN|nr:glutamate synthase subunit alpha [Oscillatoriaceae cyanobacterium M33_DOE_052]
MKEQTKSLPSIPTDYSTERSSCGVGFIADPSGMGSHRILDLSLNALNCMEHRGGCGADNDSGDGAGVLTAIPWQLLSQDLPQLHPYISENRDNLGVGMFFLSQNPAHREIVRQMTEAVVSSEGLEVIGWRPVPVAPDKLGPQARANQPHIEQLVVKHPTATGDELERLLFMTRREIGHQLGQQTELLWGDDLYICSFSSRTIVYKGMVRSAVLGEFYLDLQSSAFETPFAVYHRRFSTNTMPKWPLAQPLRLLGHNGEINTLLGNLNWMSARETSLTSPLWGDRISTLFPVVSPLNSDSANLDNAVELLVRSGRTLAEALMVMIPEAYQNQPELAEFPEIVDFYNYYAGLQEAWDGPALVLYSDGKQVGAVLDRNGLRPARYCVTQDGLVIVASEAGVTGIPEAEIVEKGRLGPGQMLVVDLEHHQLLKNWEIKRQVATAHPYGEWLKLRVSLPEGDGGTISPSPSLPVSPSPSLPVPPSPRLPLSAFGYTAEDVEMVVEEMAATGKEPTFCMGDDAPLAVLSQKPRVLYDYFKQRFAQVTNPAIDPLRESLVMSLRVFLGAKGNLLDPQPEHARQLVLESPVLLPPSLAALRIAGVKTHCLSTLYNPTATSLEAAVKALGAAAADAVAQGAEILILSDNESDSFGLKPNSEPLAYIPPLLAVGATHHHLIRERWRDRVSLVVETGQCWSTHHLACLIGYGASAVCPYLAIEAVRTWWASEKTQQFMERGKLPKLELADAFHNYRSALEAGLLKILSKMGISLLSSYQGAQIFEAIGIGSDLLQLGFPGTASRIGGLTVAELEQETLSFIANIQENTKKLDNWGLVQHRPGGEYHMNNPDMAKALHKAVAGGSYDHYEVYKAQLQGRPLTALRDLLDFQLAATPIPIEEVEPVADIVKRFCTGGMSLGALSREAHETLAIAMNRFGGKSNSGEGGEDPMRFARLKDVDGDGYSPTFPHLKGLLNGDTAASAIKQVASGRFGVTPEYLMNAQQIEIKIAQGAKPGEGGQLPGKKVSPYIAELRRSKPGVTLISPPPHHDIYSIEDLAQLIFDLHQINPAAAVSVKLVAEVGLGTIAAGVAKANADIIQISGHDGGTGASPLSSIKHAGSPWELGLTEVHRVLMEQGLRSRVLLRVDGGLKTGWDVVMAALMGAEEFGFGSIAMIAEGCIMARVCHTNGCPVGVATQQEKLRARFKGTPGHVVNFFYFVAEEVRQLLARLGYRSLNDIIGRADLLKVNPDVQPAKTSHLDLGTLLNLPDCGRGRTWLEHEGVHGNGPVLDDEILADAEVAAAISQPTQVEKSLAIVNTDRSVGARIAGRIASIYGNGGFAGDITLRFRGSAGQSFGAFNLPGMTLIVEGECNDYVGKGMHGGEIIVKPVSDARRSDAILGNTCLYGATGGMLFACGQAGERFAVRNSMAKAVIEGAGDHCCEYMTGGVVVVLGPVGRNVGAGMTGGLAYFLDEDGTFPTKVNREIVKVQRVVSERGRSQLREMLEMHVSRTGSLKAGQILADFSEWVEKFWQLVPPSEEV